MARSKLGSLRDYKSLEIRTSLTDGTFQLPQVLRIILTRILSCDAQVQREVLEELVQLLTSTRINRELIAQVPEGVP